MLWRAVALFMAAVPLGTRAATAVRAEIVGQVDSPATSHIPDPVASLHPRASLGQHGAQCPASPRLFRAAARVLPATLFRASWQLLLTITVAGDVVAGIAGPGRPAACMCALSCAWPAQHDLPGPRRRSCIFTSAWPSSRRATRSSWSSTMQRSSGTCSTSRTWIWGRCSRRRSTSRMTSSPPLS